MFVFTRICTSPTRFFPTGFTRFPPGDDAPLSRAKPGDRFAAFGTRENRRRRLGAVGFSRGVGAKRIVARVAFAEGKVRGYIPPHRSYSHIVFFFQKYGG